MKSKVIIRQVLSPTVVKNGLGRSLTLPFSITITEQVRMLV
ncbi:MAG: hypothetical protein ACK40X_11160 [Armatimonadota bacterium]